MNAVLFFAKALESAFKEKQLTETFDAIVQAYSEEYGDAEEMDPQFELALRAVFDVCFPAGETADGREFEGVIPRPGN